MGGSLAVKLIHVKIDSKQIHLDSVDAHSFQKFKEVVEMKIRKIQNQRIVYWENGDIKRQITSNQEYKQMLSSQPIFVQIQIESLNTQHQYQQQDINEHEMLGDWSECQEIIKQNDQQLTQCSLMTKLFQKIENQIKTIFLCCNLTLTPHLHDQIHLISIDHRNFEANDPLLCFMLSMLESQQSYKSLACETKNMSLRKLIKWKEMNIKNMITKDENNKTISQIIIPIISVPIQSSLKICESESLFGNKEHNKLEYIYWDRIYYFLVSISLSKTKYKSFASIIDLYNHQYRKYSSNRDWFNFATKILKAYFIYHQGGDIYSPPQNDKDGILPPFEDEQIIALVGDWGTGLRDAYDLLDQLVIKEKASIVLHLGDVYYAGFPQQFKKITDKINSLQSTHNPNLRYYTVPGNHDDYTFGGPFLQHLKSNNRKQFQQTKSFFCLRNRGNTVQFIGLDTAKNDHIFYNSFNPQFEGTYIEDKELQWAINRIKQFPGKTILLTHHQLFSAYSPINGKLTEFGRKNEQINHRLSQQLFEVLPKISCWYWGHEHSYGVPKCVILGNSAFQNDEDQLYKVKYDRLKNVRSKPVGRDEKGYYYHTGVVFINRIRSVTAKYISMTSSYQEPSQRVGKVQEILSRTAPKFVMFGEYYFIKQQSGLSLSIGQNELAQYVWLDYVPSALQFIDTQNELKEGPIKFNHQIYIRLINTNHYLYYSKQTNRVEIDTLDQQSIEAFKWKLVLDKEFVRTDNTFQILNSLQKQLIGRSFLPIQQRHCLHPSSKPSKFQIYSYQI